MRRRRRGAQAAKATGAAAAAPLARCARQGIWGALRVSDTPAPARKRGARQALSVGVPLRARCARRRRRHCQRAAHLSVRCPRASGCGSWRARRVFERCAKHRAQAASVRAPAARASRSLRVCAAPIRGVCAERERARACGVCASLLPNHAYLSSHVLLGLLAAPTSAHAGARSCAGGCTRLRQHPKEA
jgi:hypothetical protein